MEKLIYDIDYLLDEEKWKLLLSVELKSSMEKRLFDEFFEYAKQATLNLLQHPRTIERILNRWDQSTVFTIRHLHRTQQMKAALTSVIVRELILRLHSTTFLARRALAEKIIMQQRAERFSDIECLRLYRFQRASQHLSEVVSGKQKKLLFLRVGAFLQDSPQEKYITGGSMREETKRRIDIFEKLTGVRPRHRKPSKAIKQSRKTKQIEKAFVSSGEIESDTSSSSETTVKKATTVNSWQPPTEIQFTLEDGESALSHIQIDENSFVVASSLDDLPFLDNDCLKFLFHQ